MSPCRRAVDSHRATAPEIRQDCGGFCTEDCWFTRGRSRKPRRRYCRTGSEVGEWCRVTRQKRGKWPRRAERRSARSVATRQAKRRRTAQSLGCGSPRCVMKPRDFLELEGELQASRSTSTSLPALHERSEHKRWSGNGYSEGALPESSSGG